MTCKNKCADTFASQARFKVTIQSQSLSDDGHGGQTNTWTTVGTYWAMVRPMRANERYMQQQLQSIVDHEIIIRYQSTLANTKTTGSYRLLLDSRIHNIIGISNLAKDMKNYGEVFQRLLTKENEAELDG